MKHRAIIFDIYGTLLDVGPPPADAVQRWDRAWRECLHDAPRLSLEDFTAACDGIVAAEHRAARTRGIAFPEVYWPDVVRAVLPEIARSPTGAAGDSPFFQADLMHTVRLMPGAAGALAAAGNAGMPLGLASNSQPYTRRELDAALSGAGLSRRLFTPELCFFSYEHGFSKPDPHVFCLLDARLRARGIAPAETLMIGDRADHDLEPARAAGWQVHRIGAQSADDWRRFEDIIAQHSPETNT